ncbi:uncharacterized protein K452DRAFT_3837 [Aplosporella prunicola CBS 121167]|uniref:Uncharacterized protein n=1 Tax=Aplosporella prunicola CBS 121167 TaxID=1176127 RepID=A0A6A6BT16_9PEZI|nr:uncharacterized protein K452DRAFT_3837 [Aplosporella prunicola CBS 121167]KAF2147236.1 hypothetical protein K452DRAFT_3837 [Aplosporella prunicola CBS 121167]
MTAHTVEAKSLSALTSLASNPPRYPRNPTHERHEPLVLYIARVPGSRDVFLTPLKPRQKIVTAEDVQSSLYYLHFDSPDDEVLKAEAAVDDDLSSSDTQSPVKEHAPVVRKPLRKPLPPLPSEDGAIPPPTTIKRKPVAPPVLSVRDDSENKHNLPAPLRIQISPSNGRVSHQRGHSSYDVPTLRAEKPRPTLDTFSHQRGHSSYDVPTLRPERSRPTLDTFSQQRGHSTYDVPTLRPEKSRPTLDTFSHQRGHSSYDVPTVRPERSRPTLDTFSHQRGHSSYDVPTLRPQKTRPTLDTFSHQKSSYDLPTLRMGKSRPKLDTSSQNSSFSAYDLPEIPLENTRPRARVTSRYSYQSSRTTSSQYSINPEDRLPEHPGFMEHSPPRTVRGLDRSSPSSDHMSFSDSTPPKPLRQVDQSVDDVCLTLIRRDPASGAQWNVGKIRDPQVFAISSETFGSSATQRTKRAGTPMHLEINNPGYTKFCQQETNGPLPTRSSQESIRTSRTSLSDSGSLTFGPDTTFRRRIWLEGARLTPDYFSQQRLSSNASAYGVDTIRSPGEDGRRTIKSGFKGYVFQSPWNGRCEFVTGAAGSSLKCKHSLPVSNPVFQSPQSVTVSELRFNLPAIPSTPMEDGSVKRSSFFARPTLQKRMSGLTINDHAERNGHWQPERNSHWQDILSGGTNLDLSLGQESAGGGFGGNKAKLGKLIIQDEGLKMLDLIVAANMSIWWRAYGKVEAAGR